MSYKHITLNDRNKIEVLKQEGYSSRRIAKILGFHHSNISRELKRCNNIYSAVEANKDKDIKLLQKGRKSKDYLATFIEMKSRFYVALPMKDRSNESVLEAMKKLIKPLPKSALKSFTYDRGKEFDCYKEIKDIGIDFYFADPYSACQRGSNENSNGLLREYYPKNTDLAKNGLEELIKNIMELNNRPRKCLNILTLFDVFMHELSLL